VSRAGGCEVIEKTLTEKLKRIFELKVTFDAPSESKEQEALFVQVERNRSTIREGLEISEVTGRLFIFASASKMPFGFIAKQISKAKAEDTKELFFFDVEKNLGTFSNIAERSLGFIYFHVEQYHPDRGIMNQLNLTTAVTP
jgi:hypothetical protein